MTAERYRSLLRFFLRAGTGFMVLEALFHASGLRLQGTAAIWPQSAVLFAQLFVWLWASVSLLVAVVLFFIQTHLDQAKTLLVWLTLPAVLHAGILLWLAQTPYTQIFELPNLYAWIPFYQAWVRGEAVILLSSAAFVWYGRWKKYL